MWIERGWRGSGCVLVLLALAGCGGGDAPAPAGGGAEQAATPPPEAAAPAPPPAQVEPQTVADIFPEGEGRDLLLANCSSCHAVACGAIGQRTATRWDSLRDAHREHVASLSAADLEQVFAYLQANFSDGQPEPFVPPAFLEQGCTPF